MAREVVQAKQKVLNCRPPSQRSAAGRYSEPRGGSEV
jgi:hypothetical protein